MLSTDFRPKLDFRPRVGFYTKISSHKGEIKVEKNITIVILQIHKQNILK